MKSQADVAIARFGRIYDKYGALLWGAIVFALICLTLFCGDNVGLSDNADFGRVLSASSLRREGGATPFVFEGEYRVELTEASAPRNFAKILFGSEGWAGYPSIQVAFTRLSVVLSIVANRLAGRDVALYSVSTLAAMHAALFAAAVGLLFAQIRMRRLAFDALFKCAAILVLCDTGYTAYFASFYGEALQIVSLTFCAAMLLKIVRRRPRLPARPGAGEQACAQESEKARESARAPLPESAWPGAGDAIACAAAAVAFGWSKFANVPPAALIAIALEAIVFARSRGPAPTPASAPAPAPRGRKAVAAAAVCAAVAALAALFAIYAAVPGWMESQTTYNAIYFGILRDAGEGEAEGYLRDMGVNPAYAQLRDTHYYVDGIGDRIKAASAAAERVEAERVAAERVEAPAAEVPAAEAMASQVAIPGAENAEAGSAGIAKAEAEGAEIAGAESAVAANAPREAVGAVAEAALGAPTAEAPIEAPTIESATAVLAPAESAFAAVASAESAFAAAPVVESAPAVTPSAEPAFVAMAPAESAPAVTPSAESAFAVVASAESAPAAAPPAEPAFAAVVSAESAPAVVSPAESALAVTPSAESAFAAVAPAESAPVAAPPAEPAFAAVASAEFAPVAAPPVEPAGGRARYLVSKPELLLFYLRHPARLLRALDISLKNAGFIRPYYLSNFGAQRPRLSFAGRFSLWGRFRAQAGFDTAYGTLALMLASALALWWAVFRRAPGRAPGNLRGGRRGGAGGRFRGAGRDALAFAGALCLCAAIVFYALAIPIISNGEADIAKHMFLYAHMSDLLFLFALASAMGLFSASSAPGEAQGAECGDGGAAALSASSASGEAQDAEYGAGDAAPFSACFAPGEAPAQGRAHISRSVLLARGVAICAYLAVLLALPPISRQIGSFVAARASHAAPEAGAYVSFGRMGGGAGNGASSGADSGAGGEPIVWRIAAVNGDGSDSDDSGAYASAGGNDSGAHADAGSSDNSYNGGSGGASSSGNDSGDRSAYTGAGSIYAGNGGANADAGGNDSDSDYNGGSSRAGGDGGMTALLVSESAVAFMPFSADNSSDWEGSDLREWLNGAFLECFSGDELKLILPYERDVLLSVETKGRAERGDRDFYASHVPSLAARGFDMAYRRRVVDTVALPDIRMAAAPGSAGGAAPAPGGGAAYSYWLCSPYYNNGQMARCVFPDGFVYFQDAKEALAVRPAILIDIAAGPRAGSGSRRDPYILY